MRPFAKTCSGLSLSVFAMICGTGLTACRTTPPTAAVTAYNNDSVWHWPPETLEGVCQQSLSQLKENFAEVKRANSKAKTIMGVDAIDVNDNPTKPYELDAEYYPGGEIYQQRIANKTMLRLEAEATSTSDPLVIHELALQHQKAGEPYLAASYAMLNTLNASILGVHVDFTNHTVSYSTQEGRPVAGWYAPSVCLMMDICGPSYNPPKYYYSTCHA